MSSPSPTPSTAEAGAESQVRVRESTDAHESGNAETPKETGGAEVRTSSSGSAAQAEPAKGSDETDNGRAAVCEGCKRPRAEADFTAAGTCEVCDDRKKAAASRNWFALTEVTRASLHEIIQNEHTPSGSATPQPSNASASVPAASSVPYFYHPAGQRVCAALALESDNPSCLLVVAIEL